MGSTMKPTIFNDRVAAALRNWHHTARKHIKQQKGSVTPMSSRPTTPSHHMLSPVHLLRHYRNEMDSVHTSPRRSNFDIEQYWETDSPSPSHRQPRIPGEGSSSYHHGHVLPDQSNVEYDKVVNESGTSVPQTSRLQHEIDLGPPKDFSFDKRTSSWKKWWSRSCIYTFLWLEDDVDDTKGLELPTIYAASMIEVLQLFCINISCTVLFRLKVLDEN